MDPAALTQLAQQATNILVPALSALCIAGKPAVDKGKEVLVDLIYEKAFEKLGSESGKRAQALLEKISPKMSASLEKALSKILENSQDPKAKEELQQEILNLLTENPGLVKEIKPIVINFNVKNVDQLALGNYNNFFNFKKPSGNEFIKIIEYLDQKRKEAANQEILNRYNPSTLPYYPEKLKQFVTENRSEELRKALTYLENHRILLISGVGGVGKSTLARALIDLRPVNVPEPFWFNLNRNQDAKFGDILEKLATYMDAPKIASFKAEKREPEKIDIDKLTDELHRRSEIWLIFDDLSTVLEDQQFTEKRIELLFSSLRYNTHNAKIIVTSRILPIFENGESLLDVTEEEEKQHLNGLRTDFAVDYLSSNGLDKAELGKLEKLAKSVDGHPLALKLLVELVKEFGVADILEDLSMYQEQREDTILKARKLFDKLVGNEKELLERISVYREPVSMKGLKEMFTESTQKNAVKKLIDKSLLETNHNSSYWLHPLVQEFAYDDLQNKKEAHLIAYNYYKFLNLPENPTKKEDFQPTIEAHYHACEAGEFDLAAQIILSSNLHGCLDTWGDYTALLMLYKRLLQDNSQNDNVLLSKGMKVFVFGELGITYQQLGYVSKSIKYHQQAMEIAKEIGNKHAEGNNLGYLGNAYRNLGELRKAIEYYEQALKIAKETVSRYEEETWLGNLGNAYRNLGESRRGIEYHEKALEIAKEIEDKRGEGRWLGNLGNAYLHLGEPRRAIEYYEQALIIVKEIGDRRKEGNNLGYLGNAYRDLGELKKAIEYHKDALRIAKEIGNMRGEVRWLGNMGNLHCVLGEPERAIECCEKALKITREIGYKRGEGDNFENLGLAYNNLGELEEAVRYLEQALKVFKEIGYRRGIGNSLRYLGLVYSGLGESRKAIELLKQSLSIGKEIEDPRIINFCENKLKELDEIEDSENSDYYPTSNNPPASKNLYQTIVSKLKPKK